MFGRFGDRRASIMATKTTGSYCAVYRSEAALNAETNALVEMTRATVKVSNNVLFWFAKGCDSVVAQGAGTHYFVMVDSRCGFPAGVCVAGAAAVRASNVTGRFACG